MLITYPNQEHVFYPSSEWKTGIGPIEQYVLTDLYAWLETHSGLLHSFATTTATSHMAANMTPWSTNTILPLAANDNLRYFLVIFFTNIPFRLQLNQPYLV
jgi:hypothetical protein